MISRVSVGVSLGIPSIATSEPRTRNIGGEPAVMCRSEDLCATTWGRISEKSKFMATRCIGIRSVGLKPSPQEARFRAARGDPRSARAGDAERRGAAYARSARAGDAGDLGDRRQPAADLLEAVLAEPHHALGHRG